MSIKFSVGLSDLHDDREQLAAQRRRAPAASEGADQDLEGRAPGWPLRFVNEDELDASASLWAW
jgi:hypothetical protein